PAPAPEDLRTALRRTLPEAMVPAEVVVLPSLPLNANGKIDRRALAKIAPAAVRPVARFLTPQGPVEEVLAQIWTEVLGGKRRGLARIGAQDDFFTLGGHSLLATQVISRVRNAFGVELPLRALFEAPTVTALAGSTRSPLPSCRCRVTAICRSRSPSSGSGSSISSNRAARSTTSRWRSRWK